MQPAVSADPCQPYQWRIYRTVISDDLLASLKKGKTLKVGFESAQRQAIVVPVTLIGFTAAFGRPAHWKDDVDDLPVQDGYLEMT